MLKKIILLLVLIFSLFVWNIAFWALTPEQQAIVDNNPAVIEAQNQLSIVSGDPNLSWAEKAEAIAQANEDINNAKANATRNIECDESWNCLDKPSFVIETNDFSVWWSWLKTDWDSKATINDTLWTIIQKLMIGLGIFSLFIMTIWAWYMILYHGEDEFLSKWKSIFTAWILSLVIALSSYYIVNIIWYVLYK